MGDCVHLWPKKVIPIPLPAPTGMRQLGWVYYWSAPAAIFLILEQGASNADLGCCNDRHWKVRLMKPSVSRSEYIIYSNFSLAAAGILIRLKRVTIRHWFSVVKTPPALHRLYP